MMDHFSFEKNAGLTVFVKIDVGKSILFFIMKGIYWIPYIRTAEL